MINFKQFDEAMSQKEASFLEANIKKSYTNFQKSLEARLQERLEDMSREPIKLSVLVSQSSSRQVSELVYNFMKESGYPFSMESSSDGLEVVVYLSENKRYSHPIEDLLNIYGVNR